MSEFRYYPIGHPLISYLLDEMVALRTAWTVPVMMIEKETGCVCFIYKWTNKDAEEAYAKLEELFHIENQMMLAELFKSRLNDLPPFLTSS